MPQRFELTGYSERGMIWTLFAELCRRGNANELLAGLLNRIVLARPHEDQRSLFAIPDNATVLIEQSFSGFGDADVLILLDDPADRADDGGSGGTASRKCVFIEAKVSCGSRWTTAGEFRKFERMDQGSASFSNLFCQLFAKQLLVETISSGPIPEDGVGFLRGFAPRKIGANRVVLSAVEKLRPYAHSATYVGLLPDPDHSSFRRSVDTFEALTMQTCATWGTLSWEAVERFCQKHELTETLDAFEYNRGQIF